MSEHTEHKACGLCRIEVDDLSVVRDGQTLLHDVNLHVHCGELTALIGTNGAGKTTLIRALLEEIPFTGTVRHLTQDGKPAAAVRTGYVPQQLEFDRSSPVTVLDFMAAGAVAARGLAGRLQTHARDRFGGSFAYGVRKAGGQAAGRAFGRRAAARAACARPLPAARSPHPRRAGIRRGSKRPGVLLSDRRCVAQPQPHGRAARFT